MAIWQIRIGNSVETHTATSTTLPKLDRSDAGAVATRIDARDPHTPPMCWTGREWKSLADTPLRAPDGPDPQLADRLLREGAPQSWSSPQEMRGAKAGDYTHGEIDDCDDGTSQFRRIWHDGEGVWLRVS